MRIFITTTVWFMLNNISGFARKNTFTNAFYFEVFFFFENKNEWTFFLKKNTCMDEFKFSNISNNSNLQRF